MNTLLSFLSNGALNLPWYGILLYTLITTHITIAAVTIFLHRSQTHRALDLHSGVAHFFRFWLWIGTGMVTKEWVSIHRKHHAKCETADDPHSPQTRGLREVFWRGAELYRAESRNRDTIDRFGQGTPNDWLEQNVYTRFPWQGVGLMLILNVVLFGVLGLTVWAVQMLWIPVSAAGVINGVGHFWGYRNFESADAARNISPFGFLIGGEELHNNHHTYPTSAKFSVHKYEFDIGWYYIRALSFLGLATVKKVPPKRKIGQEIPVSVETLDALVKHRYVMLAELAKAIRRAPNKRLLRMRNELHQFWLNTSKSKDELVSDLADWCYRAETSGNAALQNFSVRLRSSY